MTWTAYVCPTCGGSGEVCKPPVLPWTMHGKECRVIHRQHGIITPCLRAKFGFSHMCDWPKDEGWGADGECPVWLKEGEARDIDPAIQARAILRRAGMDPQEALRK